MGATDWNKLASKLIVLALWLSSLAVIVLLFLFPLLIVFSESLGTPPLVHYVDVLTTDSTEAVVRRTLRLGVVVTIICALLGYPAAYAMTMLSNRGRAIAVALIMLPFLTSSIVRTYGWIAILGRNGPMSGVSEFLGFGTISFNGTFLGLTIAMVHMLLPLIILPIFASMQGIDKRQLTACSSLGARPAEAFVRVFFPQTMPGLTAGIIITFTLTLGFLSTPALIGGARETTVAQIIYSYINELFDWKISSALSILLLLFVLALLGLAARIINVGGMYGIKDPGAGSNVKGSRRKLQTSAVSGFFFSLVAKLPFQKSSSSFWKSVLGFDLLLMILPLIYVLAVSFQPLRLLSLPTTEFSLRWYQVALSKGEWFEAGRNSLTIAALTTVTAVIIGFFLATRARILPGPLRLLISFFAIGPMALPHIVLALGIFGVFVRFDWTGSLWAVVFAHTIVALPFAFINISNGLAGYNDQFDRAAASLGAKPWTALMRVKMPLLLNSILAAAALSFLASLDELIITLFVAGAELPTLPVRMFAGTSQNISPELAVVGTLMIVVVAVIGLTQRAFARRAKLVEAPR